MSKLKRTVKLSVIVLLAVCGLAACTPEQVAVFKTLNPEQQAAVVSALQQQNPAPSGDCYGAMHQVWPTSLHGWATGIIRRESGGSPTAANRSSSARGCFQLMMSIHSSRFYRVGCTPDDWANAYCNVKAAYTLYQDAGTSPWNL